jgi:septin family protein
MKSAYELAMERLNKAEPAVKLNPGQKKKLAELDSLAAAKVAQREIFLKGEIAKAQATGDYESIEQLEKQLASERKTMAAELEEKKEKLRNSWL